MKLHPWRLVCITFLVVTLTGCKTDLYTNIPEGEANQMVALLMLRNIAVDKTPVKDGHVTIRVETNQFVNAVELMRQNGLPRRKGAGLEDLFPSGQLVTSPAQELAKITFLKEQQLEKMFQSMDGVVSAQVSIATETSDKRVELQYPSASVFIKYSPERNLSIHDAEIRSLVVNGTPSLSPDHVSIVLQPTNYRYKAIADNAAEQETGITAWLKRHRSTLGLILGTLGIITVCVLGAIAARQYYTNPFRKR
jgi:type III secretion protein J